MSNYIFKGKSDTSVSADTAMVNPMTTAGDLVVGGTAGAPARLAKGTDTQILTLVGGNPQWAVPAVQNNYSTFVSVASISIPALAASTFARTKLDTVKFDPGSNFNPSTYIYTVPSAGIYQISGTLRTADQAAAGSGFGVGVHTIEGDGTWFLWHSVQNTTGTQHRTTYPYIRVDYFATGDQLRMFAYADVALGINSAALTILKIF